MSQMGSQEIWCGVQSCKYNDQAKYCSLNSINVGENVTHAKTKKETDCMSFEVK